MTIHKLNSLMTAPHNIDFTPVLVGGTTAGVGTYSAQVGTCVRIGNSVNFTISLVWTGHTGSGSLSITGLPFNPVSTVAFIASIFADGVTYTSELIARVIVGTPGGLIMVRSVVSGTWSTAVNLPASGTLYITGHFII